MTAKKVRGKPRRREKPEVVLLPLGTHEMAQHFHRRLDTAALNAHAIGVPRLSWTASEVVDLVGTLARDRDIFLHSLQERDAEIARLKLLLDTSTTGALDRQLAAVLRLPTTFRFGHAPQHVLVVGGDHGGGLQAELCVREGATMLAYKQAQCGGMTVHEAAAALLHDLNPGHDVTGMCEGLRKLQAPRCPTCSGTLRNLGGETAACDPCGKVWLLPDVSAPKKG